MVVTRRLAPPPVSEEIPMFLPAGRSRRSQNSVKSVSNRPNAGIEGRNYLLRAENKGISNFGKTGSKRGDDSAGEKDSYPEIFRQKAAEIAKEA